MSSAPSIVVHAPEFQGYISPEVEDAIKNDFGGDYILDFLKNKFLMITAEADKNAIYLSHSYQTIMEAIERGAFVVGRFKGEWMTLNGVYDGAIYFQGIRLGSSTSPNNAEATIAIIDSNSFVSVGGVDLGDVIWG